MHIIRPDVNTDALPDAAFPAALRFAWFTVAARKRRLTNIAKPLLI
jgi:hypothetical protein